MTLSLCVSAFAEDVMTVDNTLGFSSARVEKVDTSKMVNIVDFDKKPTESAYKITTPEGLVKLSEAVDNFATFAGVTVYLANDIDMSGITDFKPIGCDTEKGLNPAPTMFFGGTFDGQGNMIENLKVRSNDNATDVTDNFVVVALFGANKDLTIKNLILGPNCSFTYSGTSKGACVSAFCAKLNGASNRIENCYSMATVMGGEYTTAFASRVNGTVTFVNSTNAGKVTGGGHVAGFSGYMGTGIYQNCLNAGDISGTYYTAGFAARHRNASTFVGCINTGKINSSGYAGAIMSRTEVTYSITDCTNYGTLTGGRETGFAYVASGSKYTGSDFVLTGSEDKAGTQFDIQLETITPDYTPEPDKTEETTTVPEETTTEPETTTAPEATTTAPTDGETTVVATDEESTTDSGDGEKKSGCSSTVANGLTMILGTAMLTCLCCKKKKD